MIDPGEAGEHLERFGQNVIRKGELVIPREDTGLLEVEGFK
jgi:hypothetical protein